MKHVIVALLAAALAMCGCASDYKLAAPLTLAESGVINDRARAAKLEQAMTDSSIADLLDVDIRAKLPAAVAVARLQSLCRGYQPALVTIDAKELAGWEQTIADQQYVRGVHPVTPLVHGSQRPTLHSLRVAAAKLKCELILVYLQGDSSVDNYNDAAALYWTLVGLWLVPGNVYEHRTVMQAVLVDARTGVILGTATGDSHHKQAYAAAYKDIVRDKLSSKAPAEALADLQKVFEKLIGQTVQSALAKRG